MTRKYWKTTPELLLEALRGRAECNRTRHCCSACPSGRSVIRKEARSRRPRRASSRNGELGRGVRPRLIAARRGGGGRRGRYSGTRPCAGLPSTPDLSQNHGPLRLRTRSTPPGQSLAWNPYQAGGKPLLANITTFFSSPGCIAMLWPWAGSVFHDLRTCAGV